ncbi:hypothetical protein RRG08_034668 [Elysia crispata]|uniref:Uncharacterized protein n=1 Tax=Elysia crispata TaxID=231223 RepID=A0AAE0Z1E8_9GAST|nr:hypothetical protein RRG08_034668 [Elysia crispata]
MSICHDHSGNGFLHHQSARYEHPTPVEYRHATIMSSAVKALVSPQRNTRTEFYDNFFDISSSPSTTMAYDSFLLVHPDALFLTTFNSFNIYSQSKTGDQLQVVRFSPTRLSSR